MRTRWLIAAGIVGAIALVPATSMAQHSPSAQPSNHCGAPPSTNEVRVRSDAKQPGVCYAPLGNFKGSIWVDRDSGSVVIDGDSTNSSLNPCLDGYAGASLGSSGTDPHLVYSQGSNYNPDAGESDGGTTAAGPGAANDRFDKGEANEVAGCVSF